MGAAVRLDRHECDNGLSRGVYFELPKNLSAFCRWRYKKFSRRLERFGCGNSHVASGFLVCAFFVSAKNFPSALIADLRFVNY